MTDLSIIIPSRQGPYLQQTIDDLLAKAETNVEVIVILDGWWPNPMLNEDPRLRIIHQGTQHNNPGMRAAINRGVALAKGKFVMKTDEHCLFDQGYDRKLIADCQDDWLVVPRRYRLDPDEWQVIKDGRPPIDYMSIDYPYQRPNDKTCGLHGAEDRQRGRDRKDIEVDDLMTMQGSCWFIPKAYFDKLFPNGMDEANYGPFTQEAQELSNTVWLSGGRVVVNKKTWYAHMHKGKKGKGYGFSNQQYEEHMKGTEKGRLYCINYWLNTKDFKYDFEWLLQKFWPVPSWPENWKERLPEDYKNSYEYLRDK